MPAQQNDPLQHQPGSHPAAPDPPASGVFGAWVTIKKHKVVEWAIASIAFGYATLHGVQMLRETYDWSGMIAATALPKRRLNPFPKRGRAPPLPIDIAPFGPDQGKLIQTYGRL